ncbi:hypothetical protein GE061_019618 [Apolygus lucorum]|uniref:BESS domain-containing protein n=1 Tax=Apolygus lucorum TaxID=248454 RepID=A0A8S9XBK5_APOLU|nr:hypothetical protein GE061_019618 [Apolygus lucorum]
MFRVPMGVTSTMNSPMFTVPSICSLLAKEEVKAKWKNLRDNFNKELKKIPTQRSGDGGEQENYFEYPGKWQHFTQLLFLKDVLIPRVTEGNLTESLDTLGTSSLPIEVIDSSQIPIRSEEFSYEIIEAEDVVLSPSADIPLQNCEQESTYSTSCPPAKKQKRKMSSFEEKLLQVEEEKLKLVGQSVRKEDEDTRFFDSLLPYFKKLGDVEKLRVKNYVERISEYSDKRTFAKREL